MTETKPRKSKKRSKKIRKETLRKLKVASKKHRYSEGKEDDGPVIIRRPQLTSNWKTVAHVIENDGSD